MKMVMLGLAILAGIGGAIITWDKFKPAKTS
jgi:hypothetical protein